MDGPFDGPGRPGNVKRTHDRSIPFGLPVIASVCTSLHAKNYVLENNECAAPPARDRSLQLVIGRTGHRGFRATSVGRRTKKYYTLNERVPAAQNNKNSWRRLTIQTNITQEVKPQRRAFA
eukprot:1188361-Prorocentrum_minimum.AAC.5